MLNLIPALLEIIMAFSELRNKTIMGLVQNIYNERIKLALIFLLSQDSAH